MSNLDAYDNFASKIPVVPAWSQDQEKVLTEAYDYLASQPGKGVRSMLVDAFNEWIGAPSEDVEVIKDVVSLLHTSSLLIDDIEDNSEVRRGVPAAHKVFGVAQTLNSANYVYFLAFQKLAKIKNVRRGVVVEQCIIDEAVNLHRGQGLELYWREHYVCPTEEEYIDMVNNKTSGLFRIAVRLLLACSDRTDHERLIRLANLFGIMFQIRDDYLNLQSPQYATTKGFCEDLTEGKFSFPVVHAVRADPSNTLVLDVLRQRPTTAPPKLEAIDYMEHKTHSFKYTRDVLAKLGVQVLDEIKALGGNRTFEYLTKQFQVDEPDPPTRSTA